MNTAITIVVIDDHAIVRHGLELQIEHFGRGMKVIGTYSSVKAFVESGLKPQVVVLDVMIGGVSVVADIPGLISAGFIVLIYTGDDRPVPLRTAVNAGASGILLKGDPLETIMDSIEAAAAGEFCVSGPVAHALITDPKLVADLSDQQRQVLQCIDEGLDYRATARVMGITGNTVKEYLARIRDKYREIGVKPGNAHHLTRLAKDEGHLR